jgi:hypothetical protein
LARSLGEKIISAIMMMTRNSRGPTPRISIAFAPDRIIKLYKQYAESPGKTVCTAMELS